MLRKITSMIMLAALLLSLCGCSAKANSTYTGTVASASADSITLETADGKVTIKLTDSTQLTMGGFGGFGQMPEGDWTMPEGEERPEPAQKPEGDFQMPEGEAPDLSQFPEGEMPEDMTFPEGEMPRFEEGQMPEGMTRPEGGSFEGFGGGFGGMDFSSIPVGSSVTVTTGADKTATTISLSMNFGGQMPNFQN